MVAAPHIDDATSRIVELRFTETESTFAYMHSTRRYLERYGKPVAFYSDKDCVFRVNSVGALSGSGLTQFARALNELNIDIIYANSSQAKGRVERMNQTLQDRLVKELRLEGISSIAEGNAFLPAYVEQLNTKFGKDPISSTDLHRDLTELDVLDDILCWQEERMVSNSLTLQYDSILYLLEPNKVTNDLRRKKIWVYDYPDGTIALKYEGIALPHSVFDKIGNVKQEDIVSNKRLGAVLKYAKEKQEQNERKRSQKVPSRRGQKEIQNEVSRKRNPALA